jgi:hypothetical protein
MRVLRRTVGRREPENTDGHFSTAMPCKSFFQRYNGFLSLKKGRHMKIKVKTPDEVVVAFNRRELMIINNCLNEACHGLIMDRFLPAHQDLSAMLKEIGGITGAPDFFKLNPVSV